MAGTGLGRLCRRRRDSTSLFDEGALQRMEVAEAVAEAQERTAKQQAAGLVRACFALKKLFTLHTYAHNMYVRWFVGFAGC